MKMSSMRAPRVGRTPAKMLVVALIGVLALTAAHPGSSGAAMRANGAQRGSVLLSGSPGDWLLQYAPGDWGIAEDARFRRLYRRCPDPR